MKLSAEQKKRMPILILSLVILAAFWGAVFVFAGRPMLAMVDDPEAFRDYVQGHGIWGRVLFVGCMILQVLVSIIPAEPLEIGAGYAFGAIEGTILCLLGLTIGTAIIFGIVRRFGWRVVEYFIPSEQIRSLSFLQGEKRLRGWVLILYFIPGIPKDGVSWVIPLTSIKFADFIFLSGIARLFSVLTSTVGGDALGEGDYSLAVWVFVITAAVSAVGYFGYRRIEAGHKARKERKKKQE